MLKGGASIMDKMIEEIEVTYALEPIICFLEKEDQNKLQLIASERGWVTYTSKMGSKLATIKRGILMLLPSEYRGRNTLFAQKAKVLIGCEVTKETQRLQMFGRSNRARGVCDGVIYVNTGEDEAAFLKRIKMGSYSETRELIQLLAHLRKLQGKPVKNETIKQGRGNVVVSVVLPDVAALHEAYV
jgi:hypothetical protein